MSLFSARKSAAVVSAALVSTIGLAGPAAAVTPVDFAPAEQYATGGTGAGGWSEATLVSADFNNDGYADVVGTDYFSLRPPAVQLNNGDGTFQSPGTRLPDATTGVGALAAGDVNDDGKADLLLSNTAQILVYLGNGDGTFTSKASYSVFTAGQEDIAIFDANHDGNQDAVAITRSGFQMLLGKGDGTFTSPAAQIVAGIFPAAIDVASFDGNAHPDLLLIDGAGQAIQLLGSGDGTFVAGEPAFAGLILGTGLAEDFNHDGFDDAVALPEFNAGVKNAVVFLSDGTGGFGNGTYYDGGLAPVSGEVADLNEDGNADIVSGDTLGGQAVILLGNGDGTFAQGGKFALSFSSQTPVVADFDHDGRLDIAAVGIDGLAQTLSVLRNIG